LASVDVLLARAQEQVPGWVMIMLRFPPRGDGPVTASIQGPDAFHPFQRSQLTLNRATGEVLKWEPYADNSAGRKLRTWVRALHTGEAFGFAGQTVAGLATPAGRFNHNSDYTQTHGGKNFHVRNQLRIFRIH
jgi:hypothetical protein